MLGTPEEAYRAFWLAWSFYAGVALVVVLVALAVATLLIIRSNQESAGRIVRAIETRACK